MGVGLIGGSVGMALRARDRAERVVGIDLDPGRLRRALDLGAIDEAAADLAAAVADADVVVICAPVTATVPLVVEVARLGPDSILITDVGSTKGRIVAAVETDPTALRRFVGSHPIAGSERQGVDHASPDLFDGRACLVTPTARTPADRLDRTHEFWVGLGSRVLEVDPDVHDVQLALTSHMPHAIASALAVTVPPESLTLAGGSYRDGTRVAGSDGALWAGIFLDNRAPILEALTAFEAELAAFRAALVAGDRERLMAWWATGRTHRARYRDGGLAPVRAEEPA